MPNLAQIFNSGSTYEQLIRQVMTVESQPRLKLRAEQTEQTVFKGVLSDFDSRVSALSTTLKRLRDPFRSPFAARAATAPDGAGFTAQAGRDAAPGQYDVHVDRLARADTRLSKQVASGGTEIADLFVDPGDPGSPGGLFEEPRPATPDRMGERTFTVRIAQPEGEPVALAVRYTPPEGATDADVLTGLAAATNDAAKAARADGRLAQDTGVSASVVRETSGTLRLSLRGAATGYGQRLGFEDPDGILAALEVDRTAVRTGTGGGAVYAIGTGPQDSELSAAFAVDGLALYRDSNTVSDALAGVTLTLSAVGAGPSTLTVGADVEGMRSEVESFIETYNELNGFLTAKTRVDASAGTRGALAGDAAVSGLRLGLRTDLARGVGELSFSDLGVTTARDGTLTLSDPAALDQALAASPDAVGALFSADDGLAARMADRLGGLLGSTGAIARRKESADVRIGRLDDQIKRWDTRLERRETMLRDQFARLQEIATRAQSQQDSLAGLFYF